MTRIALVVSDVDGTLLTKDKVLTDGAKAAVQQIARSRHRLHHRLQPADHWHGISDRAAFDHAADWRVQRQLDRRRQAQADRAASDRREPWRSAASTCSMRSASISGYSPTTAGTRAIATASTSRTRNWRSRRSGHRHGFHPAFDGSLQDRRGKFGLCAAAALRSGDEGRGGPPGDRGSFPEHYLDVTPPGC